MSRRWASFSHLPSEFLFRIAEASDFLQRQVDTVSGHVLLNVPQNVGQLHGKAKVHGVFHGLGMPVAEDLQTDESHDGGHPIAVESELFEGLISVVGKVHLHAANDVLKVELGDVIGLGGVGQGSEDGAFRLALVGVVEAGGSDG